MRLQKENYLNEAESKKLSKAKYKLLKYQQELDSYYSSEYRKNLNVFIDLTEKKAEKKTESRYRTTFLIAIIINIFLLIIII